MFRDEDIGVESVPVAPGVQVEEGFVGVLGWGGDCGFGVDAEGSARGDGRGGTGAGVGVGAELVVFVGFGHGCRLLLFALSRCLRWGLCISFQEMRRSSSN